MTISSEQPNQFKEAGNGATTVFDSPANMAVTAAEDWVVWFEDDATGVRTEQTSGFTIADAGTVAGGEEDWRLGSRFTFSSAPAAGITVVFERNTPPTQESILEQHGPFPAERVEGELDKQAIVLQIHAGRLKRTARLGDGESTEEMNPVPPKVTRKGRVWVWHETTGQPDVSNLTLAELEAQPAGAAASAAAAAASAVAAAGSEGNAAGSAATAEGHKDAAAASAGAAAASAGAAAVSAGAAAASAAAIPTVPARGDVIVGDITLTWAKRTIGPAGTVFSTDGLDPSWQYWLLQPSAFRLTLTAGTPVTASDVLAATTIYASPYIGNWLYRYNGIGWARWTTAEFSLALDGNSGHAGYHQSGKMFDLFAYLSGATWYLCSGPAWTNDTTRSAPIARVSGVVCNGGTIDLRYGAGAGDVFSGVAATRALWLGTFCASADGQTEDSRAKRFLWNTYNRGCRPMLRVESAVTWTYSTAVFRQANANAANQVEFVIGASEDAISAYLIGQAQDSAGNALVQVAFGLDSTTTPISDQIRGAQNLAVASRRFAVTASYRGFPGVGKHKLTWLEISQTGGTTTFFGASEYGLNAEVLG